ncbi:hypothetical protein GCM10011385_13230 [Nitratireductor aestuarii]|jgi:hypothetical protein|uniref:Uncharacterized protein n=1 Tax=Nitratireductor aestuarii TaxID=1735103 RepID=A0A916W233_9HYPH|nr:hypothetical protein [Nitratireductor aestuarii]GGA60903.1 hypothetical protein GCM10011385_13230 [Nitratireductor aestuarii]
MADTITLIDHDEIRDWAAARAGQPAISDPAPGMEQSQPVLRFVFGQHSYQDTDEGPDRPGGVTIIEWDEWFQMFDERELALVVQEDVPGQRDEFHELIRRADAS